MSECVLPMFSPRSLRVSGFMFRSLIHFEYIFVYHVRKCSSFILLQVVDQFSQHHLLKRFSFLHCIFLPPLSKIRCPQVRGFISGLSVLPADVHLGCSSVHGIFQARILKQVAISFSRGSSRPRDRTLISCISCIGRQILYHRTTLSLFF